MIASVHVADVGARKGIFARAPQPGKVPGLRSAQVGMCAPFSPKLVKKIQPGRLGLVAFWDDDAALDDFLRDHALARTMAQGWRLRLAPLRAFGAWPGLPEDTPKGRTTDHAGLTAVLTLAKTRWSRLPEFSRTSAKAEGSLLEADGRIWSTAMVRMPHLTTCSLWESADALSEYAYGSANPGHSDAMKVNSAKPFHHQQVFIRFRPYDSVGHLDGKNPLPEGAFTPS